MKILVQKVKMQRRVATTSNESKSEIEGEPSLTYEEAAKSFERKDTGNQKNNHNQQQDQKKTRRKKPANAPF